MSLDKLPRSGNTASLPDKQPKFLLGGVAVSIRPTNSIVIGQLGKKEKAFGLVKPYLSKGMPLNVDTSSLLGALLHWYAEENFSNLGEVRADLCFVMDVFAQKTYPAPNTFRQRRKLLEAACREISDRWQPIRLRLIEGERSAGKQREQE